MLLRTCDEMLPNAIAEWGFAKRIKLAGIIFDTRGTRGYRMQDCFHDLDEVDYPWRSAQHQFRHCALWSYASYRQYRSPKECFQLSDTCQAIV